MWHSPERECARTRHVGLGPGLLLSDGTQPSLLLVPMVTLHGKELRRRIERAMGVSLIEW